MNTTIRAATHLRRPTRPALIAAGIAVVALLGIVFTRNFTDFAVYYVAGQSLLSGRTDLYAPDFARGVIMDYRYLPVFIVAFAPLSTLPYWLAAFVWHLVNVLAIVVIVASVAAFSTRSPDRLRKIWFVAFLIVAPYFVMALDYGNVQLIVTALMFAGAALALRARDGAAASLLALAITIKLIPALLLCYFALKGHVKLLALVLAFSAGLILLPALYFGFDLNRDLVERWYRHVIVGQAFHETNGPINMSLKGQLQRTFTTVDYTERVDGDRNYPAVNVASLPRAAIDRVWLTLSVASVLAALILIARSSRRNQIDHAHQASREQIAFVQVGLMIAVMLFIGPLTAKIYLVALLWPIVAVASVAWNDATVRRTLVVTAMISAVLPLIPGRAIQRLLLVIGTDFYVSCVVLGLTSYVLIHMSRRSQTNMTTSTRQAGVNA